MLKVDLHLHTADDPVDRIRYSARDLVERAAARGFGALAITLHDRQFADPRVSAYARDRGIVLIPGIERTIERRHVLLLNFPAAAADAVRTFDDLRRLRGRANGLVIAPHPYFPVGNSLGAALDRHADLFDAIEWTYFWTRGCNFNARAERWARARGKPIVGNSDLHDLRQLGRTYSLVDAPAGADEVCGAIRAGRVSLATSPVPPLELVRVFGGMLVRPAKPQPNASIDPSNRACRTCATPFERSVNSRSSPSSPS